MWVLPAILKSLVAYIILRLVVHIFGLKRVNQITTLEQILLVSLGVLAALSMETEGNLIGPALVALVVWAGLFMVERYLLTRSRAARQLAEGEPAVLVYHGKVLENNLYRQRVSIDELLSMLRAQKVFRLADVELAVMEPTGELSVLQSPQAQPLTKQDMLVAGRATGLPLEVIVDGQIIYENLEKRELSEKWLRDHLRAFGVELVSEVSLASVDENNELTVDRYDDKLFKRHDLHPRLANKEQSTSQRKLSEELLREKPVSWFESKYEDQQLEKAEKAQLPDAPKKKS